MNANKPKQLKKIKRKPRVKGRRLPNNRKKRANVIRGKKIAAASAKGFSKRFTMLRQNGNSVRVTGRDLIYSIPDDLTSPIQDTNIITVIPANPAYWKGTRIAALASGYQNYRPILFKITYIPMCAVTQQGNVIGGTIWDDGIDNNNIQQSLRTSNGGFMTQCYVPHSTRIRPKSNLQFNLYRIGGEFSTTSNPFIFIALAIGCKNTNNQRIIPGYFYVTWSFELKNPIGSINSFNNSGLIHFSGLHHEMNTTIINLNMNSEIPFGSYINVEDEESVLVPYYNNTPIEIDGNVPTWAFTSVSKTSSTKSIAKIPIQYDILTTAPKIRIGSGGSTGYIVAADDHYDIYICTTLNPSVNEYNYRVDRDGVTMLFDNINQNFGVYVGEIKIKVQLYDNNSLLNNNFDGDFRHYSASKESYVTQIVNQRKLNDKGCTTRYTGKNLPMTQESPQINTIKEDNIDTSIDSK